MRPDVYVYAHLYTRAQRFNVLIAGVSSTFNSPVWFLSLWFSSRNSHLSCSLCRWEVSKAWLVFEFSIRNTPSLICMVLLQCYSVGFRWTP